MVRRDVEAGGRRRKSRDALTSRPETERLLDVASAPASPRELAGEHAAVDLFARARLVNTGNPGRDDMSLTGSARTGLKAAFVAAGAVGLISTGAAFAASGHTPWAHASGAAAASTHAADPTHPSHPTDPSRDPSEDVADGAGPNVHSFGGLCRAYKSGNKADHGNALESPPFAALVAAAGGADNVATYCATVPHGSPGTHPAHPTHPAKRTQAAGPTHPAHPTQTASPSHPTHPTQAATPTGPAHPTKPAHPTQATTPTHKATDKPSH